MKYVVIVILCIAIVSCKKADRMIEVQGYIANKNDLAMYVNTSFIFHNVYYSKRSLLVPSKGDEENIIPFTTHNDGYFKAVIPLIYDSELRICLPDRYAFDVYLYEVNMGKIQDNKINLDTIFVQ